MKTLLRALLLASLSSAPAWAGVTSSLISFPQGGQRSTAVSLVQPADYLCGMVTLASRAKDPGKQADEIRQTLQNLIAAAERSPRLMLHQGPLRFSPDSGRSLFNSSKGWVTSSIQTSVRLLCRLDGTIPDAFDAARDLRLFIANFKPTGECTVQLTILSLAADTPERQREPLLELIHQQARAMQTRFGGKANLTLAGLDGPVLVRQLDDTNVELYIDYQLSVTVEHP